MRDHTEIAPLVDQFMRRFHTSMHASIQAAGFDQIEKIGPHGALVLVILGENEPLPVQDLVRRMARDKSQITRMIKDLEAKTLISRSQSPDDARVSLLSLSAEGRDLRDRLQDLIAGVVGEILSPLTQDERQVFSDLLKKLQRNAAS